MRILANNEGMFSLAIVGLTLWFFFKRGSLPPESNWPLIYYLCVVLYSRTYPDNVHDLAVYAGVGSALLVRFEFMGGKLVSTLRFLQTMIIVYIALRCVGILFYWW